MLYNGLYSLPWKPILFGSNIFEILFTDCYMLQGYTVFLWNISDRFHDFRPNQILGLGFFN